MQVRAATPGDLPSVQAIYAHHVLNGLASFEETPPPLDEIRRRYDDVTGRGLPWLAPYRARSAYRFALEDSVYVRHDMQGRGVGRVLLEELVRRCEAAGYRQIIAVIGDSAHAASINLHAAAGFLRVGTLRSVGFKFGRWVDSVLMQRSLGKGDGSTP